MQCNLCILFDAPHFQLQVTQHQLVLVIFFYYNSIFVGSSIYGLINYFLEVYDSIITTPKDINSVNHILEHWSRTRAVPGVSVHGSNMLSNEVAQSAFYSNTKSGSLHTSAKKLWLTLLNN